jgi:putative heme transporter
MMHDACMADEEGARRPSAPRREGVIGAGIAWTSRWTLHWLIIVVGAVTVGWLIQNLWSVLLPVILALVLTTVLDPPARWLETRWRVGPGVAAAGVLVGALGLVALVVLFIAPSVGSQVAEIASSASDGLSRIERWVQNSRLDVTQKQVDAVVSGAQDRLQSSASSIASGVLVGVSAVTSALINVVLTLVLTFFFVRDGRRFRPWLASWTGPTVGGHLGEVTLRMWATLAGFIRTQALVGLIDAVLIGTGLLVVGVPLALPLAVLTFVAAFAPIVGAVTVGALAVLVALVAKGWVAALIVLALVLVVQQLEGNVFLPWLQGRTLRLHAGVVLLAIVLGSTLYGVAGAFLSVPVVAVTAVVMRYLSEQVSATDGVTASPAAGPIEPEPPVPPPRTSE